MKVWDMHCDTLSALLAAERRGAPKDFEHNDLHIDLARLEKGGYMLQSFAAFVDLGEAEKGADPLVDVLEMIDLFKRLMARYPDRIAPVYEAADIRSNAAAGKISGLLTVEEGGCCKGSLGVLRQLYGLGVRMMTLTWNYPNQLAAPNLSARAAPVWPCPPNTETGLTETGFAFLAEMERLHMILDVSHLSDKGFWDVAERSTRPFVASHSDCRALAPHCRNLTDPMLRTLAEKGGLAGLNYCTHFLDDQPSPELCRSTAALAARHAAHMRKVGGIGMIALGSDFDGIGGPLEMDGCDKLELLAGALRKEGFTQDEAESIFWGNARRFFEENL